MSSYPLFPGRDYMGFEICFVFFQNGNKLSLVNQNQSKASTGDLIVTTELFHRPKLPRNMIARHLASAKEDWTGGLLSKKYHLNLM